jgi:hypothetical protein
MKHAGADRRRGPRLADAKADGDGGDGQQQQGHGGDARGEMAIFL